MNEIPFRRWNTQLRQTTRSQGILYAIFLVASALQVLAEDGITAETASPSVIPTRPPARIFGVGVGVFLVFACALGCSYFFYDVYQGNNLRWPRYYDKPYNACFCCLLCYGGFVSYLLLSPRYDREVKVTEQKQEYAEHYKVKWIIFSIFIVIIWFFGTNYMDNFCNEDVIIKPIDPKTERSRNPAIPRSAV